MDQLVALNRSVIEIRKKHANEKRQAQIDILEQPYHINPITFLKWNGENLDALRNNITDCIEKISLLNNITCSLMSRFPDCFFPNFSVFMTELEISIGCLNNIEKTEDHVHSKLVAMLKIGLTIPILHNIISYIHYFHEQMMSFIVKYVLIIPNELCVSMLVDGLPKRMDKIGELYQSVYEAESPFLMIKSMGIMMLPFYEKRYDPSIVIHVSSNQKIVERKVVYGNMNEECMFVFDLFKNKKIIVEGFFYDYLLYDPNTKKIIVFFEIMAGLLNMKIDNVMRRLYSFTFNPSLGTISMGSRICNYDSIPELNVIRIGIVFVAYLSNGEKAYIRRISISDLIGKERSFEIRNYRHGDYYCMTLGMDRFEYNDTNNKIQIEKGCSLLGFIMCPSDYPRDIDTNAAMVLFEDEMNVTHGFFPTQRCITHGDFVCNDDIVNGFMGFDAFNGDIRSVKTVFKGKLVSKTGITHGEAHLMIDYGIFISKTKKLNLIINSLSISTIGMI